MYLKEPHSNLLYFVFVDLSIRSLLDYALRAMDASRKKNFSENRIFFANENIMISLAK